MRAGVGGRALPNESWSTWTRFASITRRGEEVPMCSGNSMTSFNLLEILETKLSCSALAAVAHVAVVHDDDTASDP